MNDFLQRAQPRVIASLLAIIVVLLILILLMYLLWPQYKQFSQLSETYQLLDKASNSSQGLEQSLQATREQVAQISYQLHGDMAGLPEKQMEAFVIGHLQKVSWSNGVELSSVIPDRGRRVQQFQEALFNVKLNATYHDFFKWLQAINNELGFIVVKKFDIQAGVSDTEKDPQLAISLTLVSYRMIKDE